MARENEMDYIEVSAKEGQNVEQVYIYAESVWLGFYEHRWNHLKEN